MNPSELRTKTLRRCAAWQLKPNEHLPLLESLADLQPKSGSQVAARAIAAGYVAAFCFGAPAEKGHKYLDLFALWQHLSADEQALLTNPASSDQSKAFHGWIIEAIQFMAWSLGLVTLDHFVPCSENLANLFPKASDDPSEFIASAQLRPVDELLQEADTLYMLHWLAVAANPKGKPDLRIVLPRLRFRRHAADWVIGVAEAWDDVSLDT